MNFSLSTMNLYTFTNSRTSFWQFISNGKHGSVLATYYSITIILISMSSTGLSARPVAVPCIISTTSRPSSTSPNIVYWPSRWGVPPIVEYIFNWSSVNPVFPTLLSASAARLSCNSCSPARFLSRRICMISSRCSAASALNTA